MSVRCELGVETSPEELCRTFPVHTPENALVEQQKRYQPASSGSLVPGRCSSTKPCLQSFLHCAPIRCIETITRFLDFPSFVVLLSLNSSLLQLCDSPALQSCWTHFALLQRILRHGENVLLPRLSPTSLPLLRGSGTGCGFRSGGGKGGGRRLQNQDEEKVSPCQTFSRLLPRVTRQDLVRIGSLNSNWRSKSFATEQRQVICSGEALDKAYVLPTPPLQSSFSDYSVAPDAQLNLQACPSVGLPACLQPAGAGNFMDETPIFTVLPNSRVFAVHVKASTPRGQSVEVKLPLLPAKIPVDPDPLIKFGGYAPKGWLLGEDDASFSAAPAATAGGAASGTRISQSQRKRQQRQQRRQQLHRLHMSWVHLAPHPIRPFPDARSVPPKRSSREGSPLLFSTSQPFKFSSKSCGRDAEPEEGLGHCPLVRLLCLCLPTIEVENTQAAERHGSGAETPGETKKIGKQAEAEQLQHCQGPSKDQGATPSSSSQSAAASVSMLADGASLLGARGASLCPSGGESVFPTSAAPAAAVTPEPPLPPSAAGRVWPVALCSYSPKRSRFLAHAVVCCALREGETVQAARGRLWFKTKRQTNAERLGRGTPCIDEEPQGAAVPVCATAANGGKQQPTQKERPSNSSNSNKVISFCLQQHPSAVFVGMVAIGTSDGRILCTPPPLCLVRRCYCGGNCVEALKEKTARVCSEAAAGCRDAVEPGSRSNGAHQAKELTEPLFVHHRLSHFLQTKTGAAAPPLSSSNSSSSSSNSYDPAVTAAQAGRGVAFAEVGNFGESRGAVDYVELVRGTPWAVRMQRQDQPQLLIPTQQRDFSWHWTRAPCLEKSQTPEDVPVESMAAEGASSCGGFLAEALWLFACSKEAGLKIFRFMWSPVEGGTGSETSPGMQKTCGQWKCVFTIRGNCELVSLDINNGIIAICTPTDSRVHFLCFRHLLPAHIYFSNAREAPVISAESLSYLSRCGLPRPQRVPVDGYLATQQQQFSPLLQSPAECARLELLVARRPSFLQPLGGRRWVVIDGAVIRVVQIKVKEAAQQQKPPLDPLQQELTMHATLTGTPMEQLRQLCRPVAVEPLLQWLVNPQPAPELQTVRLCVFSHPRTIYKCAFDGVRRLLTVDLQEVLMVWDLQRYTKLCGIDLMASAESRSCSQEADGCDGNGGDICLSSDGLCGENEEEAMRSRHTVGVRSNNARAQRKAGKQSLKKQFGSGWMQKQVLAHRSNTEQQQCRRFLHATGHSSRSVGGRLSVDFAERVSVGGVWFDSSSLEPALQLQLLYDMQKGKANGNSLATHSKANAEEQLDSSCNRKDVEAQVPTKSVSGSSGDPILPGVGASLTRSYKLPKAEEDASELHSPGKSEAVDSELLTPTAVCYADEFPPLSAPSACLQLKGHALPKEMGAAAPMQMPAAAFSPTAPEASARSDDMPLDENLPPGTSTSSPPLHGDRWTLSGDSYKDEKIQQQPSQLDAAGHTNADSGGRLSFAAVVAAAAASSSSSCQQTGWSSSPTDPSLMAGLLGKEKWRVLEEAAAALGVTAEELYLEQSVQWEQLQRRCLQPIQTQENSCNQLTGECESDNPSAHDATAGDASRESPQQSYPVCQDKADGLQQAKQANVSVVACRIVSVGEASTSRGCKASESPSTQALVGSPQCFSPQGSAWMLRASPRFHPLPAPMAHNSGLPAESPMVGLLGRQRCVARRGPNAQQRHITAVCLSETCMGLLFKNLKTWQIWTFAPSARASLPSGAAADACVEWML